MVTTVTGRSGFASAFRSIALALAATSLLAAAGTGCTKRPGSYDVPLKYRPTSQLKMSTFAGQIPEARLHVGPVTDSREDKENVGENVEENTPIAIRATGDPAEFVQTTLTELLSKAGVQMAPDRGGADRVLQAELHTFWTKETNTYEAEIRTTMTLQDRTGRQLWKGTINGTAERFGRSLKAENYQEVFSDALVDLVQNLLSNPTFRDALGGRSGT